MYEQSMGFSLLFGFFFPIFEYFQPAKVTIFYLILSSPFHSRLNITPIFSELP